MGIKGSYFPNEEYELENGCSIEQFVEILKNRGCCIGQDWHIHSKKGGMMSKLTRNGYWLTMLAYNKKCYYFCEHRVIWTWLKGSIPQGMQINHKDYNRGNNNIDNLEVVTPKENSEYSKIHNNPPRGEKNGKAIFTNKQVELIKYLAINANWSQKSIAEFVGTSNTGNISRIINGKRYSDVVTPDTILSVFPTLVDYTRNKSIGLEEEIKNYCLGLCGETGELVDLVKKAMYHGKEIEPCDVLLELGDILFYLVALMQVLGFDFDLVALNNNVKLLSRYPNGFDISKSENRIEDCIKPISK